MDKADELARIACELVTKVRDDEPAAVHRWLASVVAPDDWMGLVVVLACAVPDDKPWKQLVAWTWLRDFGDGRPDTPDRVQQRRAELNSALRGAGRPWSVPRLSPGSSTDSFAAKQQSPYGSADLGPEAA